MNKVFFQSFLPEGLYVVPEEEKNKSRIENPTSVVGEKKIDSEELIERLEEKEIELTYFGENRQKILIITNESDAFVNESDKDFLGKILGAVKLTFNDVAFLNLASYPNIKYEEIEQKINFRKALIFTARNIFPEVEEKHTHYKIFSFHDADTLLCDTLQEIQEDKNKKIKLWEELKRMFV